MILRRVPGIASLPSQAGLGASSLCFDAQVGVLRGSAVTQGCGDANGMRFEEMNGRDGQIRTAALLDPASRSLAPLAGWTRCASASLLRMVGVLRGSAVTQGCGDANSIGFEESNGRDGQI